MSTKAETRGYSVRHILTRMTHSLGPVSKTEDYIGGRNLRATRPQRRFNMHLLRLTETATFSRNIRSNIRAGCLADSLDAIQPMYCTAERLRDIEARKNEACGKPRSCHAGHSCNELYTPYRSASSTKNAMIQRNFRAAAFALSFWVLLAILPATPRIAAQ